MKKSIFTLGIFFFAIHSFCQNFNSSEIQWNVVSLYLNASPNFPNNVDTITKVYGYQNDTIFDNQNWKTIFRADDEDFTENLIPHGFIRQEGETVYFIDTNNTNHQLYNFDLIEGDSVLYFEGLDMESDYIYVDFIDSIIIDGAYKKQIHFEQSILPPYALSEIWIEDIGSIHGLLFPISPRHFATETPDDEQLLCFHHEGSLLWDNPLYIGCYIHSVLPTIDFIEEGKQWNVRFMTAGSPIITEFFSLQGDSIVNNQSYQKLYSSYDSLNSFHFNSLIREEDGRNYMLLFDETEALIYDFNLSVGESIEIYSPFAQAYSEITISEISWIEYGGFSRKKLSIESEYEEFWIEGIGSSLGPIYSRVYDHIVCPDWKMVCAYNEEEQIYQLYGYDCYEGMVGIEKHTTSKLQAYPNPISSGQLLQLSNEIQMKTIQIFDYSGRHIKTINNETSRPVIISTHEMKKGIYLVKVKDINEMLHTLKLIIS